MRSRSLSKSARDTLMAHQGRGRQASFSAVTLTQARATRNCANDAAENDLPGIDMRRRLVLALVAVTLIGMSTAAGYRFGFKAAVARSEDVQSASQLADAIRTLKVLTALREKKGEEWIFDLEASTSNKLGRLDPGRFREGSNTQYVFREFAPILAEYRKRFPDTNINAQQNPQLAKILNAI